ncbi:amino acid adenylation domain-containing protein [Massilia sp. CCM 8695]|uniref:Amino acid adenylation domain-containing protein n=1 Tax=Massilia frigida TaxID=2609281 RepID=A0ABX0NK32_9BURK|nr:non-ribosomal peptide synthetase [Massilia frigida]NHZ83275.1 amino acid adenylation domain-containing protein [Massilia frigida]
MTHPEVSSQHFVDLLRGRAARHPDRSAIQFLLDGDSVGLDMSYGELDRRARRMAAWLQRHASHGERALLLYPTGPDYVVAFFGCLYAGIIAVPAYPPELAHPQHLKRLLAMLHDAAPRLVLTDSAALPGLRRLLPADGDVRMLATDALAQECHEDQWQAAAITPATLAFLQYTSGSTATPKGVMVSHRNLIGNELALAAAYGVKEGVDKWVSWLPLYHDMGLICALLQPIFSGITLVLMSPRHFLERPLRWLKAIAEHKATISGGPDFAYRLCLERIGDAAAAGLDLSSWRLAFNGAEPVRDTTFRQFAAKFAPGGFGADALYPCYGLAEATVFVSGGVRGTGMIATRFDPAALGRGDVVPHGEGVALVACGLVWTGHQVSIVDPGTMSACADGRIGEIWVRGASVAEGYWRNDKATADTYAARMQGETQAWMRTGDLGFWHEGQLYIAGRLKDLVILRGQNVYPQDVEQSVEAAVPEVRKGRVAVFPVDIGGVEGIGVAAELPRAVLKKLDAPALFRAIHRAIAFEHQEPASVILLLAPGELPKTSSGKLQRAACRSGWLDGSLPLAAQFRRDRDWLLGAGHVAPRDDLQARLAALWSEVLGVPQAGIHDNFFELGGDSLLAVRLLSRLRQGFGVDVAARTLFEAPTVAQLAERVRAMAPTAQLPLLPAAREGKLALSFAQQRLWFLHQMAPHSAAYNLAATLRLSGVLDLSALRSAFACLLQRHEALRTTFRDDEGQPEQVIAAAAGFDVPVLALNPALAPAAALRALAESGAAEPFDLGTGPLLRASLVRLGEQEHALLLVTHHIVSDGWSMSVLLREFAAAYDAEVRGAAPDLAPLPIQYADYAHWQRQWLSGEVQERQLAYWKSQLGDRHPVLALPADRPRPAVQSHRGATHRLRLPAALTARLHQLGHQHGATLFMVMLAAFDVLLHRLSGQSDIRVGVPVAGRNRVELEGLIGFFVNTQVMRAVVDGRHSFATLLRSVREAALGAQAHQDLPFEQLVEALQPQRSLSHLPLCQEKFAMQQRWTDLTALSGLEVTVDTVDERQARFDLALDVTEIDGELACVFNYATDLFDASTIARWAQHWTILLAALADAPQTPVAHLPLLDDAACLRLRELAQGPLDATPFQPVQELVAAQAVRRPDAPALVCDGHILSYAELDARANRMARYLAAQGVGQESRVAVCLPRGIDLVVAILGILKAGAAYVPLDPAWPAERRAFQVADSGAVLVIDAALFDGAPLAAHGDAAVPVALMAQHAAYVIYTSGSTGQPKGVVVQHGGFANYVAAVSARMPLDGIERMAFVSTVAADLGHTVLFGALANGCALHLMGEECAFDPDRFGEYMAANRIDALKIVPSHLAGLLQAAAPEQVLPRHCLLLGGEASSWSLIDKIERLAPGCRIINHYGPTETTVGVLVHPHDPASRAGGHSLPLGGPLANNRVYVLDEALNPAPAGVVGELHIGGAQLARGYLGRPDLTAERFVPDPFGEPGARMYRSGDAARLLADGNLVYIGRRDDQVKIRGYRVEPGEIAAQLKAEAGVADAAVVLDTSAEAARLVAYVVVPAAHDLDALRQDLARRLPDYMVPALLVRLAQLPLTANGKLDRSALPQADTVRQAVFVAPSSDTERILAAIWEEVLKLERVGAHDNFFALGGDSILSLQIIARARRQGLKLLPKQVFEQQTIAGLAQLLDQGAATRTARAPVAAPLPRAPRDGMLPLSFSQQRLWFLHRMEPDSAAYNVPALLRFSGALDAGALQRAFAALVARHEILRTTFKEIDGIASQVIGADADVAMPLVDLRGLSVDAQLAQVQRRAREDAAQPFDLSSGPLLRLSLLKLAGEEHVLLMSLHHIVSDGWSLNILVREFSALYVALRAGGQDPLPALPLQYADFAAWQRTTVGSEAPERELRYWKSQLGGEQPVLELPADRPRPAVARPDGARHRFVVGAALAAALRKLARDQNATLFMTMKAAFDALLFRLTGQHDIRVGVPIASRGRVELEGLIGFFVNTQVMRAMVDGRKPFAVLLAEVREAALGAQAHQELPFEQLVEALQPERDLSRSPLFQVMFNVQRPDFSALDQIPGLKLEMQARENGTAQFDLSVDIKEAGAALEGAITYRTDLFDAATIERMGACYLALLEAFAGQPQLALGDAPMLAPSERHLVTQGWNDTDRAYPQAKPVHQLFASQAVATPDAPALVFRERSLSYRELDMAANRLAHRLAAAGVGRDSLVGVCAERSLEMVVGLLAILKAGAAYLPLDPDHPPERLSYMIDDAGLDVLLTQAPLWAHLALATRARVLPLDLDGDAAWPADAPHVEVHPQQLAYTIYTSGSTGQPKGAGVPHAGLNNRLAWMQEAYRLDARDRVLQKTPFGFDVSVWEFFWPLISGATLVMAGPGAHKDPAALAALVVRHGITTMHFVPSMLQAFVDHGALPQCTSLTRVLASGEALPAELLSRFLRQSEATLYNLYGPTEASIDVTAWTCSAADAGAGVPIGRPIANTRMYVLDAGFNPVPVGVVGELYIGGVQLARGYHRRAALTAERFLPDPFGRPGARLYRSGDLARWRADGALDYLGRTDHQVKIRGVRIELGEIEARLLAHPAIGEAVVVAREEKAGDKRLVAYAVASAAVTDDQLRSHLRQALPEAMVPAAFVLLDAMPLSANGKLDRKALPAPEYGAAAGQFVAPSNETEALLAQAWSDVLGVGQVGIHDNFFALGGDSILALQMVSRARQAGLSVTPKDLFQYQTVAMLALVAGQAGARIAQGAASGEVPLTPIQAWFFGQEQAQPHHWNQAVLLQARQALDVARLEAALHALVEQHDSLRLRFARDAGGAWRQSYAAQGPHFALHSRDVPASELDRVCTRIQGSLDLARGPLLAVAHLRLSDGEERLLLAIHHLVVDGVSWRVLLDDLQSAYGQLDAGVPVKLPAKTSSYQAWAGQVRAYASENELAYWATAVRPMALPAANPQGANLAGQARRVEIALSAGRTRQLLQQAPAAYRTQVNDLLLAALAQALCGWSGSAQASIEVEGHGREDLFDGIDLSRSVGWFTSRFPVSLAAHADPGAAIKAVKESLRAVPNKGIGWGVLDASGHRAVRALPQPQVCFNYLGQLDTSFGGLFALAPEGAGESFSPLARRSHWLTVNGQVANHALSLSWTYSPDIHTREQIEGLANAYRDALEALIDHCLVAEGDVTPSDFPDIDIGQDDLDRFLEEIL